MSGVVEMATTAHQPQPSQAGREPKRRDREKSGSTTNLHHANSRASPDHDLSCLNPRDLSQPLTAKAPGDGRGHGRYSRDGLAGPGHRNQALSPYQRRLQRAHAERQATKEECARKRAASEERYLTARENEWIRDGKDETEFGYEYLGDPNVTAIHAKYDRQIEEAEARFDDVVHSREKDLVNQPFDERVSWGRDEGVEDVDTPRRIRGRDWREDSEGGQRREIHDRDWDKDSEGRERLGSRHGGLGRDERREFQGWHRDESSERDQRRRTRDHSDGRSGRRERREPRARDRDEGSKRDQRPLLAGAAPSIQCSDPASVGEIIPRSDSELELLPIAGTEIVGSSSSPFRASTCDPSELAPACEHLDLSLGLSETVTTSGVHQQRSDSFLRKPKNRKSKLTRFARKKLAQPPSPTDQACLAPLLDEEAVPLLDSSVEGGPESEPCEAASIFELGRGYGIRDFSVSEKPRIPRRILKNARCYTARGKALRWGGAVVVVVIFLAALVTDARLQVRLNNFREQHRGGGWNAEEGGFERVGSSRKSLATVDSGPRRGTDDRPRAVDQPENAYRERSSVEYFQKLPPEDLKNVQNFFVQRHIKRLTVEVEEAKLLQKLADHLQQFGIERVKTELNDMHSAMLVLVETHGPGVSAKAMKAVTESSHVVPREAGDYVQEVELKAQQEMRDFFQANCPGWEDDELPPVEKYNACKEHEELLQKVSEKGIVWPEVGQSIPTRNKAMKERLDELKAELHAILSSFDDNRKKVTANPKKLAGVVEEALLALDKLGASTDDILKKEDRDNTQPSEINDLNSLTIAEKKRVDPGTLQKLTCTIKRIQDEVQVRS